MNPLPWASGPQAHGRGFLSHRPLVGCATPNHVPPVLRAPGGTGAPRRGNPIAPRATMLMAALLLVAPACAIGVTGELRHRVLAAVLITAMFAAIAHRVHAVNLSGAVAGAAMAFLLYVS